MSVQLVDVLNVCRQIRGNDHDSGAYYFLGYLWANTSEFEKQRIATLFKNDLLEQEKNK
jgi:hypothetical protein